MKIRNRSRILLASGGAFMLLAAPLAVAAPGDELKSITVPVPSPSGAGIGIAADCETPTNLYYTNSFQAQLHKMDWQANDLGSVPTTDSATGAPISFGAIAWDEVREVLWAGTDSSGSPVQVYKIDPNTGVATYVFTAHSPGIAFCDGIDYDPDDDTIYVSDDISTRIDQHRAGDGSYIRTLIPSFPDVPPNFPRISGVLVGKGDLLLLGRNGYERIDLVKKSDGSFIDSFAHPGGRVEDLACDTVSFAPLTAIWSKDAYDDSVTAFEVEPETCECPPPPPPPPIPAVSTWGMVVIALLLLTGGKIYFGRRRPARIAA